MYSAPTFVLPNPFIMHFKSLYNLPGMVRPEGSLVKLFNKVSQKLGLHYNLVRTPDGMNTMHTLEQRMNFMLLTQQVINTEVQGEWIEAGCFDGQSAMIFQKVLQNYFPDRSMWLYDNFQSKYGVEGNIRERLEKNFKSNLLNDPHICAGDFYETIPAQLPQQIAFGHIDCGFGGEPEKHKEIMLHLLRNIYPRLSPKAVLILMDYHDPDQTMKGDAINAGVKLACDEFFTDKPEEVFTLFGNRYSHGYIIKK